MSGMWAACAGLPASAYVPIWAGAAADKLVATKLTSQHLVRLTGFRPAVPLVVSDGRVSTLYATGKDHADGGTG